MILFLYGSEGYLLKQKLDQVIGRAKQKGIDDTNTAELDGFDTPVSQVQAEVTAAPFLAEQRLVIIRDWLRQRTPEDSEAFVETLASTPASTIAVVVEEGEPDKRRIAFKKLEKLAEQSWHFVPVDEVGAVNWVLDAAKRREATIDRATARRLVEEVGVDLWALSSELAKLSLTGPVTNERIDALVTPNVEGNIFRLVDAIGRRQTDNSLQELRKLIDNGEPPLKVFAMIVRQFRLLVGAASLIDQHSNDATIAKELGVRPFLVRSLKNQAGSFSETELRDIYDRLVALDRELKTSKRDAETALELFIVEVCEG